MKIFSKFTFHISKVLFHFFVGYSLSNDDRIQHALVEEEPDNNVDDNNNSNNHLEDAKVSEDDEEIGDSDLFTLGTSIYELVKI